MEEKVLDTLPEAIQSHIKAITQSSGLPDTEESYEKMAEAWVQKRDAFEKEIEQQNMVEVETLSKDETKGAVALTYSGSLILLGPLNDGVRKVGYNSIGLRKDIPKTLLKEKSVMATDLAVDQILKFEVGPVSQTSMIHKIAVCKDELQVVEEEEKISEVTMIVTNEFIGINNALVPVD